MELVTPCLKTWIPIPSRPRFQYIGYEGIYQLNRNKVSNGV